MIRRSLAFLCDSGGRLQKSGNVDCDPVIRSAALLKGVIKRMSRRIGHLLPVACGGRAEYVWTKIVTRDSSQSLNF
ncbi:hypothetical protein B398_05960 [Xylella fastidiosa 32]|nr:hypothetical protein B398_05960 [Xylella fastidiosa 32]KXB20945.1 hypothetical protein ADT30_05530 [Xylella fastidiosa]